MTSSGEPGFDDLVSGLAEELGEASVSVEDGAAVWSRAGARFALVRRSVLEVRLPADIADAALRTPDTTAVPGEHGWVRFEPHDDAAHVVDRAQAWFVTAWRHAAED